MTILRCAALAATLVLAGCPLQPRAMLVPHSRVEVQEVWRSQQCKAPDATPRAFLFRNLQELIGWLAQRGLSLPTSLYLADGGYALVDMGAFPTAGYGVAVSRDAVLRGDGVARLNATFVRPAPGGAVAQVRTSPCALVALPAGARYTAVEVADQEGRQVAASAPRANP